jgi:effector-binding domain-containing protein
MSLNERYDVVTWPDRHYVYVEKIGSFQINAPKCWQEIHQLKPALSENCTIVGAFSLYKVEPQIYRAGFSVAAAPAQLPMGVNYLLLKGADYTRFVLTGSYSQLPQACGRVFEIVQAEGLAVGDGFFVENYANDPQTTPDDQLITEILIPAAK